MNDTDEKVDNQMPVTDKGAEKDTATSEATTSTRVSKKRSASVGSAENKDTIKHDSLKAFIIPLYSSKKLNKTYKESFKNIQSKNGEYAPLTVSDRGELLELALESDSEHKVTLELIDFLLEKQGNPTLREYLLTFTEYLVSHTGNLKKLNHMSIFQVWLDQVNPTRPLDLLCDQIDQIKDGMNAKGEPKYLTERTKNNLKCIAAIWLYLKNKASFQSMTEQLSTRAFSLKGESCSEPKAVGFIASMVGSSVRDKTFEG